MRVTSVTLGIPVSDLVKARVWYETLLQKRGPDIEPDAGVVEYQVGDTWLQLFEGAVNSNGGVFRIGVPDIRTEHSRLVELGLTPTEVKEVPGGVAYCDFRDPDGNQLSLYTVLDHGYESENPGHTPVCR
ncbi:MAG: VOC family protein [Sulfobacillus benefaciens]|uniref:VOC family protein n=1 Tax=Sulfobacillus benefaciens TaxID=453960 RepID=A0A2T2WI94_9FIRM|nr:MAG: VOC family protein [Sulfobacillus benefaciens]